MNILLHGCNGRMGGVMTRIIAVTDDATVTCGVDARTAPADGLRRIYPVHRSFAAVTEPVDVVIDFSHAWCLGPLAGFCVSRRVPLVSGTTGLTDEDRLLLRHAAEAIPVLSAPNMSLGVSVIRSLARATEAALGREFGNDALLAARSLVGRRPGLYGIEDVAGSAGQKLPITAN